MERALRSRASRPPPARDKRVSTKETKKNDNKRKAVSTSGSPAAGQNLKKRKLSKRDENSNDAKTQSKSVSEVNVEEKSFYDFASTDESEAESKDGDEKPRLLSTDSLASSRASTSSASSSSKLAAPAPSLPRSTKISRNFYATDSSESEPYRPPPQRKKVKLIVDDLVGEVAISSPEKKGKIPVRKPAKEKTNPAPQPSTSSGKAKEASPTGGKSSNNKKPLDKNMIDFLLSTPTKDKRGGAEESDVDDEDTENNEDYDEDKMIKQLVKTNLAEEGSTSKKLLSSPPARKRVLLRCSPAPKVLARGFKGKRDGDDDDNTAEELMDVDTEEENKGNEESEEEFFERFSKAVKSNSPKKKVTSSFTKLTPKKEKVYNKSDELAKQPQNLSGKKFFGNRQEPKTQTTKPLTSFTATSSKKLVFNAKPSFKGKSAGGVKTTKWAEKYKKMHIPKVEALPVGRRTPSPLPGVEETDGPSSATTPIDSIPADSATPTESAAPTESAIPTESAAPTTSECHPVEIMTENRETPSPDIDARFSTGSDDGMYLDVKAKGKLKPKKSVSFSPLPPSHRRKEAYAVDDLTSDSVPQLDSNSLEASDAVPASATAAAPAGAVATNKSPAPASKSEGAEFGDGGGEEVEDIFGFGFGFVDRKSEDLRQEEEEEEDDESAGKLASDDEETMRAEVNEAEAGKENPDVETRESCDGNKNVFKKDDNEILKGVEENAVDIAHQDVGHAVEPADLPTAESSAPDLDLNHISVVGGLIPTGPIDDGEPPAIQEDVGKPSQPTAGPSKPLHPFFLQRASAPTTSTPKVKSTISVASKASKRSPPAFVKKAFEVNDDGKRQMMLDVGQKNFGARQCPVCDMVYTQNHPNDEIAHQKFHHSLASSLSFPEWKKQRVVSQFVSGKIVQVLPSDPKYMQKKVGEMEQVMNQNLGFLHRLNENDAAVVYLYVADSKVVGCCIAQQISSAYKVIVERDTAASPVSPDESFTIAPHPDAMAARDGRVYYCSKESTPALVGVNRIWVLPEHRRKHVATRLLDSVRATLIYGTIVEKDQIAFTDPTPDGRRLASRYTEREDFLVYNL